MTIWSLQPAFDHEHRWMPPNTVYFTVFVADILLSYISAYRDEGIWVGQQVDVDGFRKTRSTYTLN